MSHAVSVANGVASLSNPIVIKIGAGIFAEDNTGGPITISADGISLVGSSISGTTIVPFSTATDLFLITTANVEFNNLALVNSVPGSTASAVTLTAGLSGTARFTAVTVGGFQTGFAVSSAGGTPAVLFNTIQAGGNGTVIDVNAISTVIQNSLLQGPMISGAAANTGVSISNSEIAIFDTAFVLFNIGISAAGSTILRLLSTDIESSTTGLVCSGGADISLVGCNFLHNNPNSVNVAALGANTALLIEGCGFLCTDTNGIPQGTAIEVTTGAAISLDSCAVKGATLGIECGVPGDTITTALKASGAILEDCTQDINQQGSSTLNFFSGVLNPDKISIQDPTNVSIAAFNDHAELVIGTGADVSHTIYEILNGQAEGPSLVYEPNYYGNQGTVYINQTTGDTFNGTQALNANASYYLITSDNTKATSINLISDTANTGTGDNVRGWSIIKTGTAASLAFTYTNNDPSGQALRGSNSVMQLNGFDNQVEFPLATNAPLPTNTVAKLIWAGDTNLYRSAANTLKTDGNFVIGGLSSTGIVHTDATGQLSTSLIVNADISPAAAITDDKLATISTPGKVANSATTATSANTPNTIILRDASGNFSAGTITASLTGASSLNVLKTGDTMTGNLNMANQSEIRFQDLTGTGTYVGLRAPATVTSSYTVDLPASAPTAGQFLQAISPTALQWAIIGGSPGVSKTYYVALNGSDSNDGSLSSPFRTVSHAVSVANSVASLLNPIVIKIGAGIFVEDNSGGPITITASGISIVGSSVTGTVIVPASLSNDLFNCTTSNVFFETLTLDAGASGSTANGLTLVAGAGQGGFQAIIISRFQIGLSFNGSGTTPVLALAEILPLGNGTAISINNARVIIESSIFLGQMSGSTPANNAISITGTNALVTLLSDSFRLFETGVSIAGAANVRVLGSNFETTTTGITINGGSTAAVVGSNFIVNSSSSVNISATGDNTTANITGCSFDGTDTTGASQGTAIQSTNGATVIIDSCSILNNAIGIFVSGSTPTEIAANSTVLRGCTIDIQQVGSSILRFVGGTFDSDRLVLANPTNVIFSAFDRTSDDALTIGSDTDISQTLYQVFNGQPSFPNLSYQPNYYGNKGTIYINPNANPTFNGVQSQSNDANYYVITTDNTKATALNLISDTSNIGNGDNVRGWSIVKTGTSASLAFTYTNNDSSGQALRGSNSVMQLNGFDNQVEFPLATNAPLPTNIVAKLVWAGDTNLYRSAANTLKTDGNFVVGGLSSTGVVHTDATGQLSTSLIVNADISPSAAITDDKLATISTPGKVANSATTATSTNTPNTIVLRDASGNFSAGTITANLSGNATSATTAGSATNFTGTLSGDVTGTQGATVVSSVGGQSAANVASATVAANAATSTNVANTIVRRDASGNFAAGTITANLAGNATSATTATTAGSATNFTGTLSGDVTGTQGATVVSSVGGQTAANIASATVAANAATSLNTPNTIVRRDASGNFFANTITAALTGAASLNVLKAGDTMTGTLTLPAGTAAAPALQFTGSTNTGLSAPAANTLALSTNGTRRLAVDSTGSVTYQCNYKMYAYRSANQSVNNTTATVIFNTELLDPNANYNTATGVYTVPVTGVYMINANVCTQTASFFANVTQTINIVRNGAAVTGASDQQIVTSTNQRDSLTTTALLSLTAGDTIRIDYTTNGNDTIQANSTHIAIHFMSF